MNRCSRRTQVLLLVLALVSTATVANATLITLQVSPTTPTQGTWAPMELVEVLIIAYSDGLSNQGLSGADFRTDDLAISVLDPTRLKIWDVWGTHPVDGLVQVDTEEDAELLDVLDPSYEMDEDTWVYDEFTDFVYEVTDPPPENVPVMMTETTFEAVADGCQWAGEGMGTGGTPVELVHLVLQIQPGFSVGESSLVKFYGQVAAYGTDEVDTTSDIFGRPGPATNWGTFEIEIIPEPAALGLLLTGMGVLLWRRKRTG